MDAEKLAFADARKTRRVPQARTTPFRCAGNGDAPASRDETVGIFNRVKPAARQNTILIIYMKIYMTTKSYL